MYICSIPSELWSGPFGVRRQLTRQQKTDRNVPLCSAWQQAPKACSIICTIWSRTFMYRCLCVAPSDRAALFHWCAPDFNNITVFLFGVQHLENVSIWGISASRWAKLSHGSFCCCLDAVPRSKRHHHMCASDIRDNAIMCCKHKTTPPPKNLNWCRSYHLFWSKVKQSRCDGTSLNLRLG